MTFSAFDKRLLEEGTTFFTRPRLASLLESLGRTEAERAVVLAAMLRNSCMAELEEAASLFERGLVRAAQRQMRREHGDRSRQRREERRN